MPAAALDRFVPMDFIVCSAWNPTSQPRQGARRCVVNWSWVWAVCAIGSLGLMLATGKVGAQTPREPLGTAKSKPVTEGSAPSRAAEKTRAAEKGRPAVEGKPRAEPAGKPRSEREENTRAGNPRAERENPRAEPGAMGAVEDVGPDVYYLPDENGKLRPVPGWTLEDFRRLIEQQDAPGQAPAYSLQRLTAHGNANGTHARLTVEITVQVVRQPQDRWVRVPLQMNSAILAEPAKTSRGNLILEYQPAQDGYVAWLRGVGEEPLVLTFNLLLPLKSIGGDQQLTWNLPRVAPAQLKLQVPVSNAEAQVSAGATLLPPVAVQNGSELTVLGLGGELRLSWHPPDQQLSSRARLLEAEGAHLVRIERGAIRTQAQLAIRSLGGEIERVRVRLPRGARLVPNGSATGYTIKTVEVGSQRTQGRPVIEIQAEKKIRGTLNVQFVCEQSYDVSGPQAFLDMATFEVEGAARHWGNIAVQVMGDWHLFWQDSVNVRRVDSVPSTLPSSDLTAAFEYSGQPYLLSARVAPPVTRISVEPQYVVSVSAEAPAGEALLKLDARLKCRVSGAKIFELPIDLAGWELEEGAVGPASRVDQARILPVAGGFLKVPLLAPLKGEFEITLNARRRLKIADGALTTGFPRARVDNVAPATIVIVADDNVQLTPRSEALVGLAALPVLPSIELPPRMQSPFFYRAENLDAKLVADVQVHTRTVTADVVSRVRMSQRSLRVQQTLDFNIAYEAVEWLSIQVPRELAEPGVLKIRLDGALLVPLDVRKSGPGDDPADTVDLRLPLPKPRIGDVLLHIDYQVPVSPASSDENSELSLPLVMPAETTVRRNDLIVEPVLGATAELVDRAWPQADETRGVPREDRGRRYQASGAVTRASLIVGTPTRPASAGIVIHRGWVQSWFSGDARHDQAVYLLSSREDRVLVELPDGAEGAASEIWIDGKPAPPVVNAAGSLVVSLPAVEGGSHRLMLRYVAPKSGDGGWLRRVALPRFPDGTWVQKMYWQLVLPPDEHLLAAPASTTAEYQWRNQGWAWQRHSLLDERELAAWVGVPEEDSLAPVAAQRYLLSVSKAGDTYLLPIVPRAALVLLAAGGVLGLGLLWIYFRQLRRPSVVFSAVIVLVGLCLLYPEPAIVLCQAATLGLGLVVLVALLQRWFGIAPPAVVRSAPVSNSGNSSTEFLYQPSAASTGSTGNARSLPAAKNTSGSTKAAVN
ncbi:MAG: hypothetical protein K8T91_24755 [Planctomycetes bacterium]|nr:hypothetical protein [Planctomycetota bacterium]